MMRGLHTDAAKACFIVTGALMQLRILLNVHSSVSRVSGRRFPGSFLKVHQGMRVVAFPTGIVVTG